MSIFAGCWFKCNARSEEHKHNFGRTCRCELDGQYGGGGLPILYDVVDFVNHPEGTVTVSELVTVKLPHKGPHICEVCKREFTK